MFLSPQSLLDDPHNALSIAFPPTRNALNILWVYDKPIAFHCFGVLSVIGNNR